MYLLHFLTIFCTALIINIQSAPAPVLKESFYDIIKSSNDDLQLKCPYLRNTKLLEPEPEFLKKCNSFTTTRLLEKLSFDNLDEALCLLYFNHFIDLCRLSNNLNISSLVSEAHIEAAQNKKTDECNTLKKDTHIVEQAKPGIEVVLKGLQSDHCKKMCLNYDDEFKPICSLTAFMINVSAVLLNASIPAVVSPEVKAQKELVGKPKITEVQVDNPESRINTETNNESPNTEVQQTPINDPAIQNKNEPGSILTDAAKSSETNVNTPIADQNAPVPVENKLTKVVDANQAIEGLGDEVNSQKLSTSTTKLELKPEEPVEQPQENINVDDNKVSVLPKDSQNNVEQKAEVKSPVKTAAKENKDVTQLTQPVVPGNQPIAGNDQTAHNDNQIDNVEAAGEAPQETDQMDPDEDDMELRDGIGNEDYNNYVQPKSSEVKAKPAEKSKPLETDEDTAGFAANYQNQSIDDSDSYFFSYFMMVCIMFICGYVAYHNKQKILALIVEGRKGRRSSRSRRPNSSNYRKLDSNLEEAVTSSCNKSAAQVIY